MSQPGAHRRANSGKPVPVNLRRKSENISALHQRPQIDDRWLGQIANEAPVMIWGGPANGQRTYFNRQWIEFRGRLPKQEYGWGWLEGVHPDDRTAVHERLAESAGRLKSFRVEYRLRRRDGTYRRILDVGAPRLVDGNTSPRFVGSATDVTGQKRTKGNALAASPPLEDIPRAQMPGTDHERETLRLFLESVNDGLLVLDREGTVVDANAIILKMFGMHRQEVLGASFSADLSAPGSPPEEFLKTWAEVLEGNDRLFSWKARRPRERSVFDVEVNLHRLAVGRKDMVLATIQDVTQRQNSERERLHVQRMKILRSVLGGIAHEVDGIVNNVLGYTYMLRKYAGDGDRSVRYRTLIEDSAKRGTELADRLFALTTEATVSTHRIQPTDLLRAIVAEFEITVPSGISVLKEIPAGLPVVCGDERTLRRGIILLLENALAAVSGMTSGRVGIKARVVQTGDPALPGALSCFPAVVAIDVSDNGPGIPGGLRDGVLDLMVAAQGCRRGDGLVLAEVQATAWNHHGDVTFSESVAEDSTFTFWLPALATGTAIEGDHIAHPARPQEKETVLLVEHDDDHRARGRRILECHGYNVITAADGQEAIDTFRGHGGEINLVILDLVTPHVDGGHAYLELKSLRKDVPVLFCLGHAADQVVTSLLNEQGLRTVKKPFDEESLLAVVRELLDERWEQERLS